MDSDTLLSVRHWPSQQTSKRPPILLIHGYGEYIGRYEHVVTCLRNHDFEVWGYDARGHGQSEGLRGVILTDDILVDDCIKIFNYVAESSAQKPIVIAHSMGGLTAGLAVAEHAIEPAALVLSSPLLRVRMNLFQQVLLNMGLLLFKDKAISSRTVDTSVVARDKLIAANYRVDPQVHCMISPRFARWMRDAGQFVIENASTFTMPTLLMYAKNDEVVDASGSDDLAKHLPKTADVHSYANAFHEIFNEPEAERQIILEELTNWLSNHFT